LKKTQPKYLILFLILTIIYSECDAWGSVGHKITAKIAYSQLNKATKDSLGSYLGESTIEDASVWMDEVRSNHEYDYQKPWHYINIEKGASFDPMSTDNIVWELQRVIAELKERNKYPKEQIATDLKILIHLVGDLHQPLHVGYGSDKGGNTVHLTFLAENSNLHKVWDTEIIKEKHITEQSCLQLLPSYSKEDIAKIEKLDVVGWMNESRSYLPDVYGFQNDVIDQKYIDANSKTIEKLLLLSGLRISHVLEDIFK
jgi:hypothetical protein